LFQLPFKSTCAPRPALNYVAARNLPPYTAANEGGSLRSSETRCVFSQSLSLTSNPVNQHPVHRGPCGPEIPPSDVSAWRAVVRVLRSTGTSTLDSLSTVLFPADCRVCGLPLAGFTVLPVCPSCWNDLPSQTGALCACCGEAVDSKPDLPRDTLCRPCRVAPPDFQKAVAHGVYQGKLRTLLHLLKYDGMEPLAKRLGALLAEQVLEIPNLPEDLLAVPVPLYRQKRRARGFNQSELLARGLLAALRRRRPELHVQLVSALLVRKRATESQAGLNPHERRENVRGAFAVPRPDAVKERNVLLIDDIYTTGATARACSQALRRAGAASILVATVARAQKEQAQEPEALDWREPGTPELPMEQDFVYWEEGRYRAPGSGHRANPPEELPDSGADLQG
jgi:ComF family protein